jgi:hypothetical protein
VCVWGGGGSQKGWGVPQRRATGTTEGQGGRGGVHRHQLASSSSPGKVTQANTATYLAGEPGPVFLGAVRSPVCVCGGGGGSQRGGWCHECGPPTPLREGGGLVYGHHAAGSSSPGKVTQANTATYLAGEEGVVQRVAICTGLQHQALLCVWGLPEREGGTAGGGAARPQHTWHVSQDLCFEGLPGARCVCVCVWGGGGSQRGGCHERATGTTERGGGGWSTGIRQPAAQAPARSHRPTQQHTLQVSSGAGGGGGGQNHGAKGRAANVGCVCWWWCTNLMAVLSRQLPAMSCVTCNPLC